MDSAQHQAMTGVGNGVILDNLTRLCRELPRRGGKVIVRMPLIPGYNDDDEAVAAAKAIGVYLPETADKTWGNALYECFDQKVEE